MNKFTNEQLSAMVSKQFNGGELMEVMDNGNLVIKHHGSYTQVRARDINTLVIRSNIVNDQIQLSDEVKTQIRVEKMGAKPEPSDKPTLGEQRRAEDKSHRDMVQQKYGIE